MESWVEDGVTIDTLRFNLHAVHLRRVDWRKLSGIHNAVALALLGVAGSRLQVAEERVQVAIAFYRGLLQTVAEPQDRQLLTGFFEAYMHLSGEERLQVLHCLESLGSKEAEAVEQIWTPLHEEGFQEGLAKGEARGIARGYVEVVLRLVRKRLGELPPEVESSVRALPSAMVLDLADAVLDIQTTDQLRAWLAAH